MLMTTDFLAKTPIVNLTDNPTPTANVIAVGERVMHRVAPYALRGHLTSQIVHIMQKEARFKLTQGPQKATQVLTTVSWVYLKM